MWVKRKKVNKNIMFYIKYYIFVENVKEFHNTYYEVNGKFTNKMSIEVLF